MNTYPTTIPRTIARYIFALFFIGACVAHFIEVDGFAKLLPEFVPFKTTLIILTGVIELTLAIMILIPAWRRRAGIWTAWYLVLIFPANIYAAIYQIPAPGQAYTDPAALWIRLIFQPLMIWWILWCTRSPKPRTD